MEKLKKKSLSSNNRLGYVGLPYMFYVTKKIDVIG